MMGMPLIGPRSDSGKQLVSVTKPKGSHQTRISFNAMLARALKLSDYEYMAIDHDPKTKTVTFIPSKTKEYRDGLAYKLIPDGGGQVVDGRAVYVRRTGTEFLEPRPYPPTIVRGRFFIDY
jgi:hypothetical protein